MNVKLVSFSSRKKKKKACLVLGDDTLRHSGQGRKKFKVGVTEHTECVLFYEVQH